VPPCFGPGKRTRNECDNASAASTNSIPTRATSTIVEDELLVALEIERALLRGGFAVAGFAARAEAAIRMIEDHGCEAAVLDVRLADGTSARIVEVLAKRSIPFALLTAYSREQLPEEFRTAAYVKKPLHGDALVECLRGLLGIPDEYEGSSEQAV
jgi:DNA-binding NarL/FixJ family response regulator